MASSHLPLAPTSSLYLSRICIINGIEYRITSGKIITFEFYINQTSISVTYNTATAEGHYYPYLL